VKTSGVLADASRDFKGAISAMRISAQEFTTWPSEDEDRVKIFRESTIASEDAEHKNIGT
jgi:hypothetical protein